MAVRTALTHLKEYNWCKSEVDTCSTLFDRNLLLFLRRTMEMEKCNDMPCSNGGPVEGGEREERVDMTCILPPLLFQFGCTI